MAYLVLLSVYLALAALLWTKGVKGLAENPRFAIRLYGLMLLTTVFLIIAHFIP